MRKFDFYNFQPIITAAALVLAGCASSPEIHKGLATTTPVTQNRDYAIYDWQTRHAAVIEFNRTHKPEIVFIGDSIIHYWGGNPVAPKAWASDVWNRTFAGMSVENLGFGWDRTENVLWRIDHGELDGISPKLIIIDIGTTTPVSTVQMTLPMASKLFVCGFMKCNPAQKYCFWASCPDAMKFRLVPSSLTGSTSFSKPGWAKSPGFAAGTSARHFAIQTAA